MHAVVDLHGLGQCKVHVIRVCVHAVVNLQGLANKIDRVKNARTRIVQASWN